MRSLALAMGLAIALDAGAGEQVLPVLYSPPPQVQPGAPALSLQGRFAVLPARNFSSEIAEAQPEAAATTIALWGHTVAVGGVDYHYIAVGKNPLAALSTQSYNVPTYVIPVQLTFTSFGNFVADPTAPDANCSAHGTALNLTAASPLFNAIPGSLWGTNVGTGQYVDLFQRANYNAYTKPTGVNPDYHTTLVYTPGGTLMVPVSGGNVTAGRCGQIGMMDFATWDNYLQTQVMPLLAAQSPQVAPPTSLVIFLLYNVVLYQGTTSDCCILGYHSAFNDPAYGGALHTYISVEYDSSRTFSGVADVSPMSHEIGEWMNDPSGNNPTPSWGNIGQVSGCTSTLEVGDPLSGTLSQIYMAGSNFTYHVQDLAFTSWFYRQHPSTGVNGWYSFLGKFLNPSSPC